jgi:hypothetical protein
MMPKGCPEVHTMQRSGQHRSAQSRVRPGTSTEFGDHLGFVGPAFKFHVYLVVHKVRVAASPSAECQLRLLEGSALEALASCWADHLARNVS